jgi:hypothetical protein
MFLQKKVITMKKGDCESFPQERIAGRNQRNPWCAKMKERKVVVVGKKEIHSCARWYRNPLGHMLPHLNATQLPMTDSALAQ